MVGRKNNLANKTLKPRVETMSILIAVKHKKLVRSAFEENKISMPEKIQLFTFYSFTKIPIDVCSYYKYNKK